MSSDGHDGAGDTTPRAGVTAAVRRAQAGDAVAFEQVVEAFQDLAAGVAYAWLGDAEAARDVAQEAFLDAHRNLAQLREPAAFPGWLRRIVKKHCDRITRRRQLDVTSLDTVEPLPADTGDPQAEVLNGDRRERLRLAVDALPAG